MSYLIAIDFKNSQILHPEVLKLVDSFQTLTEKEILYVVLFTDYIYVHKSMQQKGFAMHVVRRSIDSATAAGIDRLHLWGGRNRLVDPRYGKMRGYYTWPRLGFDGDLSDEWLRINKRRLRAAGIESPKRVSDLMSTKQGREYWFKYGKTIELEFDLKPRSFSRRVFNAYRREKKARSPAPIANTGGRRDIGQDMGRDWEGTINTRWQQKTTLQKLEAFRKWLRVQLTSIIMMPEESEGREAWWQNYLEQGYRQGAKRAFDDVNRGEVKPDLANDHFKLAFGRVVPLEKLGVLVQSVKDDLAGVTQQMENKIIRAATDGLSQGQHPQQIARQMRKVSNVGLRNLKIIAQTATIKSHAEGTLDALEKLGIDKVGVLAEFSSAGDNHVCPRCKALDGMVFTIKQARGKIPQHPLCRCTFIPARYMAKPTPKTDIDRALATPITRTKGKLAKQGRLAKKMTRNFNTHHDRMGRFTYSTGEGGGGSSTKFTRSQAYSVAGTLCHGRDPVKAHAEMVKKYADNGLGTFPFTVDQYKAIAKTTDGRGYVDSKKFSNLMKTFGIVQNTFFGHKGRPGSVGGSMPRGFGGSTSNPDYQTNPTEAWMKSQEETRRRVKSLTPYHDSIAKAKVRSMEPMPSSDNSNIVHKVTLESGHQGIFKNATDQDIVAENSRANISMLIAEREVLCSEINDILGLKFVPTTVMKDVRGELGSFQMYAYGSADAFNDAVWDRRFDGKENERLAAAFDYFLGHSDRHEANWRLPPEANRLILIDNGLSLPSDNIQQFTNAQGERVSRRMRLLNARMLGHLERWGGTVPKIRYWKKHWPEIQQRLEDYGFDEGTQDAMKDRLDALVDHIGQPFSDLKEHGPVDWREEF